jgi:MFS family permease
MFVTNDVRKNGVPVRDRDDRDASRAQLSEVTRYPGRWLVFAVVLLADVMDLVDSTVTNVGGPAIRGDLGGGATLLQWLGAAYTLAFAVLLATGARLGDVYGRRRLFLIGASGFTAASAACALAWSPDVLIALRAVQGAFGALMIPQGFGMMKETLADDELPTAFAVFGPVMGVSAVLGPIIGALRRATSWARTGARSSWSTCRSAWSPWRWARGSCPARSPRAAAGSTCPAWR